MTLDEAIDYFGTKAKLCKILGIHRQSIYSWMQRGQIPAKHQLRLQSISQNQLIAEPDIKINVVHEHEWQIVCSTIIGYPKVRICKGCKLVEEIK